MSVEELVIIKTDLTSGQFCNSLGSGSESGREKK